MGEGNAYNSHYYQHRAAAAAARPGYHEDYFHRNHHHHHHAGTGPAAMGFTPDGMPLGDYPASSSCYPPASGYPEEGVGGPEGPRFNYPYAAEHPRLGGLYPMQDPPAHCGPPLAAGQGYPEIAMINHGPGYGHHPAAAGPAPWYGAGGGAPPRAYPLPPEHMYHMYHFNRYV